MRRHGRLLTLVCEGSCGAPHTQRYDEAVRCLKPYHSKDLVIALSRHLVHAPHEEMPWRGDRGRSVYRCLTCRTERLYGWPESGAHATTTPEHPAWDLVR